jgi:hypothetical protein
MSDTSVLERLRDHARRQYGDPKIELHSYNDIYYVPVGPKQMGDYTLAPLKWCDGQWRLCHPGGAPGEYRPCMQTRWKPITGAEGDLENIYAHMVDSVGD